MTQNSENTATLFVVLFEGRAGSTYLCRSLDLSPRIRCAGEEIGRLPGPDRAQKQLAWAHEWYQPRSGELAIGFKVKHSALESPEGFAEFLQREGVAVIYLRRRNVVKAVVSNFNAVRLKRSGQTMHITKHSERLPPPRIAGETFSEWLEDRLERDASLNRFVESLHCPVIELCYEDMILNDEDFFKGVYSYLRVPYCTNRAPILKHTSDDLRVGVANFDELRARFANTKYAEMFDEVLVPPNQETSRVTFKTRLCTWDVGKLPVPRFVVDALRRVGIRLIRL